MGAPPSQRRDFGESVAGFSQGFINGARSFFEWISSPFDQCGGGVGNRYVEGIGGEEKGDDGDGRNVSKLSREPVAAVVAADVARTKSSMATSALLTAEALGSLDSTAGTPERQRNSLASNSTSSTLSITSSGSNGISDGDRGGRSKSNGRLKGRARKRANLGVRFSHEVSVVSEWEDHLARSEVVVASRGRDRAAIMVEGDDFWSLVEENQQDGDEDQGQEVRRGAVLQPPPRMLTRAALFAMEDGDNDGSTSRASRGFVGGARKAPAYGRMRDILASGRASVSIRNDGNRGEGVVGCFEEEDGDDNADDEDGEGEWYARVWDSYDGSLESMKSLVLPVTYGDLSSRPAKKLFDDALLAPTSPARWMTPAELDGVLGRTKGWKNGSGHGDYRSDALKSGMGVLRREEGRTCEEHPSDAGISTSTRGTESLSRVSVDNSVLKEELFGLAMEEGKTSVLFKRAFLNWERSKNEGGFF